MAEIKLIVGLGNPGKVYEVLRHNLGFRVVSEFAKEYKIKFKKSRLFQSLIAKSRIEEKEVIFLLPLTFMNNSGEAVRRAVERKKIKLADLLVVLDDASLPFGILRIRPRGSSAGHNGLNSVIEFLKSPSFSRLRLGIKSETKLPGLREFVLAEFSKEEKAALKPFIKKAGECILSWLSEGTEKAMNKFNKRG